jgi:hypothetical protein
MFAAALASLVEYDDASDSSEELLTLFSELPPKIIDY